MCFWFFSFFFWPPCAVCGILVHRPGIKPMPPAVEAWSINHWTARKVPIFLTDIFVHWSRYFLGMNPKNWDCSLERNRKPASAYLHASRTWACCLLTASLAPGFPISLSPQGSCGAHVATLRVLGQSGGDGAEVLALPLLGTSGVIRAGVSHLLSPGVLTIFVYRRIQTHQSGRSQSRHWIWLWWAFDEDGSPRA